MIASKITQLEKNNGDEEMTIYEQRLESRLKLNTYLLIKSFKPFNIITDP